eukprot:CAMPEP_0172503162 /NCGR_PEP_ID=MMETSP1066-20121228/166762_1 /TAXON_ID=671091 /ORGANISM="Coscinodiscus wailesii, Strain CCMP2513" /LENGTH=372 /DNA_ID=CAMNT_0013278779 /DNA_START=124 /DNA_END=1239 /DNA_ORIENTATION=+
MKPSSQTSSPPNISENPNNHQEVLNTIRSKTKDILSSLSSSSLLTDDSIISWLEPTDNATLPPSATDHCRNFHHNGFLHLPQFCIDREILAMKAQMEELVDEQWHPGAKTTASFRTDEGQIKAQGNNDYFLDSAARIHFFAEVDALDDDGCLKEEYKIDKLTALNKSGHGLHVTPGAFHSYATSDKICSLVESLGYVDPVIPQSMYIFKQARIGGVVTSHQDSTFLYTTPRQTCLGLWLALDDATLENGCLWVRPKSHREPLRRRFSRNDAYFTLKDPDAPKMIMESLPHDNDVPWDGGIPKQDEEGSRHEAMVLWDAGFVPIECRAGDLVVFPGTLDHLSLANKSGGARHTFQLHLVEGPGAGVVWEGSNW